MKFRELYEAGKKMVRDVAIIGGGFVPFAATIAIDELARQPHETINVDTFSSVTPERRRNVVVANQDGTFEIYSCYALINTITYADSDGDRFPDTKRTQVVSSLPPMYCDWTTTDLTEQEKSDFRQTIDDHFSL